MPPPPRSLLSTPTLLTEAQGLRRESRAVSAVARSLRAELELDKTRRLIAAARGKCAASAELIRTAEALRASILSEVRKHPYRRSFRLARGGTDVTPRRDGATPVPDAMETSERRCPYCKGADGIKALGKIQIADGMVRSMYCCAACDRAFVYVRRALS
jgi:hypothetical protein